MGHDRLMTLEKQKHTIVSAFLFKLVISFVSAAELGFY